MQQTVSLPNEEKEVEANFHINQPTTEEWMNMSLMDTLRYILRLEEVGVIDAREAYENIEVAIHG